MKAGWQAGSHYAHCFTGSKQEGDLVRRFSLMSLVSAPIALALEKKIKKPKNPEKSKLKKLSLHLAMDLRVVLLLRIFVELRGEAAEAQKARPENFLFKRRFPFSFSSSFSSSKDLLELLEKKFVGHILLPSAS